MNNASTALLSDFLKMMNELDAGGDEEAQPLYRYNGKLVLPIEFSEQPETGPYAICRRFILRAMFLDTGDISLLVTEWFSTEWSRFTTDWQCFELTRFFPDEDDGQSNA